MTTTPKSIAILGAGATGLSAAFHLERRGHRVRVFEATGRVGGSVRTELSDGWLIESGPNSLLAGEPALTRLIDELGLTGDVQQASPGAKNRYIVRGGKPVAAPVSPPAFLTSPLFSFGAKLRLFGDLFMGPRVRTSDISLHEFVRAHFGQELVDYGLNPFVGGVYAGNPLKLSARHSFPQLWEIEQQHGSIIRGQIATAKAKKATGAPKTGIFSLTRGLQMIPDALAARLASGAITLNARIEALVPGSPSVASAKEGKTWNLVWNDGTTAHTEQFDTVVSALPAPALAQLRFGTLGERPLAALDTIEHPPVASLFLGFRREQVAHPLDGFGVLMPELEKRSTLGILFSSSLFPGRAPEGYVALTVMAGGVRQPQIARLPADKLLSAVEQDLRELLGVSGAPVFQRHAFWPRAIPQYNLGYGAHLDAMAACERAHPGLFIGGQARDGIALPACLAAGEKLASRVCA
ncbi:MAG: protoporphyrinogen oxidase [Verrucomicrobia bacterium]|nr:protoporphyrinogen oxidase [Verrucomicrobiota bacterium]